MWRMTMKNLALIAIAAVSIFSASAAYAGWYDPNGVYHQTCGWVPGSNGPVWVCK